MVKNLAADLARVLSAMSIDQGVSICIRPGSPFWQVRIPRFGHRTRECVNTDDVEAAKAISRKRLRAWR